MPPTSLNTIPEEKQEHLKNYYCTKNFGLNRDNLLYSVKLFEKDLAEIFKKENIPYKPETCELLINRFEESTRPPYSSI